MGSAACRAADGWYNQGYIFPEGFESRVNFRSSIELDQLCVHECSVTGKGGKFWPAPTFKVVAMDRPDEPLIAKSCTGCWTGVRQARFADACTTQPVLKRCYLKCL